jgi:hypothetical protein
VGGFDGSTGLNSAEMYDPRTHEWRMIAPMSTRRSSVGVGVVNGFLYAVSPSSVMAGLHCHTFDINYVLRIVYTCVSMWFELYCYRRREIHSIINCV